MKAIALTKGQSTIVDDHDYDHLAQWKWQAHWNPCTKSFYAVRSQSLTPGRKGKRIAVWMHREILGLTYKDGRIGDHKESGVTLDNRRSNLRITNASGNTQNARLRGDSRSGFKGVSWYPLKNKWLARIQVGRKRICLGYFPVKEDAACAYREAAKQYHGEFARTS